MKGSKLVEEMKAAAISDGELALAAGVDLQTILDYRRPSRPTSEPIRKALKKLQSETTERFQAMRTHLHNAYEQRYAKSRHPSTVRLPEFAVSELAKFLQIVPGMPTNRPLVTVRPEYSWGRWRDDFLARVENAYRAREMGSGTVVMGDPGGGKTTLVKLLLTEKQLERFTLVMFPVCYFARGTGLTYLTDQIANFHRTRVGWDEKLPDLNEFTRLETEAKRLIWVFDGFDEITEPNRHELLHTLGGLRAPFLLTSRYVRPDPASTLNCPTYHLPGLPTEYIVAYAEFVLEKLKQGKHDAKAVERVRAFVDQLRDWNATRNSAEAIVQDFDLGGVPSYYHDMLVLSKDAEARATISATPESDGAPRRAAEARHDVFTLLSQPVVINIALVLYGEYSTYPSREYLLEKYIEFLAEKYVGFRTLAPGMGGGQSGVGRVDFVRILAAMSWLILLTQDARPMNHSQLRTKIAELLGEWGQSSTPKEDFEAAIQAGLDSQLLDRTAYDGGQIRFAVSAEIVLSYFAGRFIEIATNQSNTLERALRDGFSRPATQVEWASLAAYEQVLNRPSLAMSRDAIFFYLHRRFVDPGAAWIEADYRWRQLERTPPLPENDAGTDAKTIHAILPTNKIIAWRVLAAPEVADLSQGKPLADVRGRLEEELKLLYKETPFEFVFQALYNCCGKLLAEKGGPDPARGAEGWRYQRSGQGLRDWIGEWAPPSKLNEWLRGNGQESSTSRINISFRRAIYMFRYLQRVTDADIAFMREVCSVASGAKNGMQALAAGQLEDRVLGTLRGLKPVIDSSPISSDNYAWISDELAREDRDRRDLQKQMADLWEMANSDLELLLEEFIHSDKFTLHQLFSNQGELRRMLCLSHSDDWHERLRGICEIELAKAQSREAPKLGKGTTKALCELEGRILLLVTLLTTSHRLRMFFLPPHYSMREVDLDEPPRKYFDHDGGFLKLLFNGAKLGLRQEGSIGEQDRVDLPAGEFQTYDLYVRAIWMLLREDPFTLS